MRLLLFVSFFTIAILSLTFGIVSLFKGDTGYQIITTGNDENSFMDDELVLNYYIGNNNENELKEITKLYSDLVSYSYKLLDSEILYDDIFNIAYINNHLSEEIEIDSILYNSFKMIKEYDLLFILYLGPLYYETTGIIYNSSSLDLFSPLYNNEVNKYFNDIIHYVNNNSIELVLLDNNKIKLVINNDYLDYIKNNNVKNIISFGWIKNAIMVDYIANNLMSKGYIYGILSSVDGYTRILDSTNEYNYSIIDYDKRSYICATIKYNNSYSIVNLRNYIYLAEDYYRILYINEEEIYSYYLDSNGKYLKENRNIINYSLYYSCLEISLNMFDLFFNEISINEINRIYEKEIFTLYCDNKIVYYNDKNCNIYNFEEVDGIRYNKKYIK